MNRQNRESRASSETKCESLETKNAQLLSMMSDVLPCINKIFEITNITAFELEPEAAKRVTKSQISKIVEKLKNNGFDWMDVSVGDECDPELHKTYMDAHCPSLGSNKIINIIHPGWTFNGKVIFRAIVTRSI